ncbi:MAG: hypothetical protein EA417_22195 [Gammaproteobacteria bacterium]|nr:MAG: hypothetical protein EA417_22195 [Gammaproteobacteria bacterium]
MGPGHSLDTIVRHLQKIEDDIRQKQVADAEHVHRTNRFTQTMVAGLALVALLNLYFVGELAHEIEVLIRNMDRSVVHLEEMGDRMTGMQVHVQRIGDSAGRLPIVVDQMGSIGAGMQGVEEDLGGVRGRMERMRDHVAVLDQDVELMTGMFREVNGKLVHIRHNMRQMSNVVP